MLSKSAPNPHRPLHIYADETYYFVTGSTLHRAYLLTPTTHKPYLKEQLFDLATKYELKLEAWVILNNHYHVLFHLTKGDNLSRFFKHLHGHTSTDFNKWEFQSDRRFWYSYWDWCIRDERDYWQHFNYIHYNSIKHRYVQKLRDWPFSSIFDYLEEKGQEWLNDCWRSYPIKEFAVEDDNFQECGLKSVLLEEQDLSKFLPLLDDYVPQIEELLENYFDLIAKGRITLRRSEKWGADSLVTYWRGEGLNIKYRVYLTDKAPIPSAELSRQNQLHRGVRISIRTPHPRSQSPTWAMKIAS